MKRHSAFVLVVVMLLVLPAQLAADPADCDCLVGDSNGDGINNIGDTVYLLRYIFQGGPAPTPYLVCSGDNNCDGIVNVSDVVYSICYIFQGCGVACHCEEWVAMHGPPH